MIIQIYESFDDQVGELWETIEFDLMAPSFHTINQAAKPIVSWLLKCDFRLPAEGVFRFANPVDDNSCIELGFKTPYITIPNYIPGSIRKKSFTPELKKMWEDLPNEIEFTIGKMTLTATKDIVDAIESNNLGVLYVYRPTEILIG